MKWYFCLDDTPRWLDMAKVAVHTAGKLTGLDPVCLYSGRGGPTADWLRSHGVEVIPHQMSCGGQVLEVFKSIDLRNVFIRCDLPLFCPDDYFLYTDVDVVFYGDLKGLNEVRPKYLAAAPQQNPQNWDFFNAGVMVFNGKAMKESYEDFMAFVRENMHLFRLYWEQQAYNEFYAKKWDRLPLEYNWKPYWGKGHADWRDGLAYRESPIQIVHFHGAKPWQGLGSQVWEGYLNGGFYEFKEEWRLLSQEVVD